MITPNAAYITHDRDRAVKATRLYLAPAENFDHWLEEVAIDYLLLAKANKFAGQAGKVLVAADAVFVGIGDGADHLVTGAAAKILPTGDYVLANPVKGRAAELACLGWALGAYRFSRYRKADPVPVLILPKGVDKPLLDQAVDAVTLVRDLVNTPTEDMGPGELVAAVRTVAVPHKAQVKVIEGDALLKQNFPLVHAVGRAADRPPCLIDLTWGNKDAPKITLVGKGVCFDTGGLNIKVGQSMRLMKKDMGGAANALALASMIMAANLNVRLRLIIPAVENAINGNAFRPGDVFSSRKGITVEISNTDAEGRLVLADALALAADEAPAHIFSFATLTGAARVALGPELAPVYSTDGKMAEAIADAGTELQDPVWRMPFWKNYESYLDSSIADVNHASDSGFAGSITAALFLKKFVPDDVPYTHFDIFAWNPTDRPAHPQGGEAFGIRAVFDVLKHKYGQS